jgi:hypothetical protein
MQAQLRRGPRDPRKGDPQTPIAHRRGTTALLDITIASGRWTLILSLKRQIQSIRSRLAARRPWRRC